MEFQDTQGRVIGRPPKPCIAKPERRELFQGATLIVHLRNLLERNDQAMARRAHM